MSYAGLEVGDLVDVDLEYDGVVEKVRIVKLVPDVALAARLDPDDDFPTRHMWDGPGALVKIEHANDWSGYELGDQLWVPMQEIVTNSKNKYFFPEAKREILKAYITEVIRKCGSKWCLYSKSTGKKLGTHDTKEDAEDQEKAIHAHGG